MNFQNIILFFINLSIINGLIIPNLKLNLKLSDLVDAPVALIEEHTHFIEEQGRGMQAPIVIQPSTGTLVPGQYIVVLKENLSLREVNEHNEWIEHQHNIMVQELGFESFKDKFNFINIGGLLHGYHGYFTEDLVALIKQDPKVKLIEQDSVMKTVDFEVQKDAPWGLSRVSHRELAPSLEYLFDNDGGKGVNAYVIDTGVKVEHEEFEGRASWGDSIAFPKLKIDANGHGTHCAGIIGSKTYGIAKEVNIVAVGVMNILGSGTVSDIIKGVEFVVNDHEMNVRTKKKGFKGSVINMSIGGGASEALDLAVNAATSAGLHIAVAAGNENEDACNSSPARAIGPITVGAINNQDSKASFSNWGSCIDIFAPGEDIVSTYIFNKVVSMSGTSMASPHIAGLLSYYLSLQPDIGSEYSQGNQIGPLVLKDKLIKYGSKNMINNLDDLSPNILAYNGAGGNLTEFWGL